jgi:hypothetical protein
VPIDPYATESAKEIPGDLWRQYTETLANVEGWSRHLDFLKEQIQGYIGEAHAGTVGGEKVVTYRPTATYAVTPLRKAYPELTQHFETEKLVTQFDLEAFKRQHADLAEQFRSRSFRVVEG